MDLSLRSTSHSISFYLIPPVSDLSCAQNQLLGPLDLAAALKDHKKKFKDKTKNAWEDRADFVKHDKKYHYLERDYGADDD